MAKLYTEVDSDKHGRKASKGGETFLRIDVFRKNTKLGTLGVYEVMGLKTCEAYRIEWHPVAGRGVMLADTEEKANSTAQ